MAGRYQEYGKPGNVVVGGWKNFCGKEQVPEYDDPVGDDNQQSEDA